MADRPSGSYPYKFSLKSRSSCDQNASQKGQLDEKVSTAPTPKRCVFFGNKSQVFSSASHPTSRDKVAYPLGDGPLLLEVDDAHEVRVGAHHAIHLHKLTSQM
jgi:hypothetical protein